MNPHDPTAHALVGSVMVVFVLVQVAFIVVFIAMVGTALRLAARNAGRRNVPRAIAWAALAASPFLLFFGVLVSSDHDAASRAQYLAALPRERLGGAYPRTLEARAYFSKAQLGALIGAGLFDQVYKLSPYPDDSEGAEITVRETPDCQTAAKTYLGQLRSGRRPDWGVERAVDDCTTQSPLSSVQRLAGEDAVLLLTGDSASLHPRKFYYTRSGLEVRVRRNGTSELVDYWERPYALRPAWPFTSDPLGSWIAEAPQGPEVNQITFLVAALER